MCIYYNAISPDVTRRPTHFSNLCEQTKSFKNFKLNMEKITDFTKHVIGNNLVIKKLSPIFKNLLKLKNYIH